MTYLSKPPVEVCLFKDHAEISFFIVQRCVHVRLSSLKKDDFPLNFYTGEEILLMI